MITLTKTQLFKAAHAFAKMAIVQYVGDMTYRDYFGYALRAINAQHMVVTYNNSGKMVLRSNKVANKVQPVESRRTIVKSFNVGDKQPLAGNLVLQRKTYGYAVEGRLTTGKRIFWSVTDYEVRDAGGLIKAFEAGRKRALDNNQMHNAYSAYVAVQAMKKYQSVGYVA